MLKLKLAFRKVAFYSYKICRAKREGLHFVQSKQTEIMYNILIKIET